MISWWSERGAYESSRHWVEWVKVAEHLLIEQDLEQWKNIEELIILIRLSENTQL